MNDKPLARAGGFVIGERSTMAMSGQEIVDLLKAGVPNADIRIEDVRGDGEHFSVTVTSPAFNGLNRIQQHRMIYAAINGKIGVELHALSIHTREK